MLFGIGAPRPAPCLGDGADVISSRWTVALTLTLAVIMTVRTYILSPIECHLSTVNERDTNYLAFSNNFCFVKGSVAVAKGSFENGMVAAAGKDWTEEEKKKVIGYYPWIPLYLGVTALLPYLISVVWKLFYTRQTGDIINDLLSDADRARVQNGEERRKTVERISSYISDSLWTKRQFPGSPFKGRMCAGICLNVTYVAVKLAFLASHALSLVAMHSFLGIGKENRYFGVQFFAQMLRGNFSDETLIFPRITWCRVPLSQQGHIIFHVAQCVLPGNLFSETIFALLWMWHVIFFFPMLISLFLCLFRACKDRRGDHFLRKGLTLFGAVNTDDIDTEERIHTFSRDFLQEDGVLTLRLLEKAAGGGVTSEITAALWERYERMHDCLSLPRAAVGIDMDAPTDTGTRDSREGKRNHVDVGGDAMSSTV